MKSPCIKVCVMDPQRGVCLGCWRTLDEIAAWGEMAGAERERVMAELDIRRRELGLSGKTAARPPA